MLPGRFCNPDGKTKSSVRSSLQAPATAPWRRFVAAFRQRGPLLIGAVLWQLLHGHALVVAIVGPGAFVVSGLGFQLILGEVRVQIFVAILILHE